MSISNGVVRISRKGKKKFAFGDEGEAFEIDVVEVFQKWIGVDEQYRDEDRNIPNVPKFHEAAVNFVKEISKYPELSTSEALDFLARLREVYDELALFFRPKSLEERGLLGTSEGESTDTSEKQTEMRFSMEAP